MTDLDLADGMIDYGNSLTPQEMSEKLCNSQKGAWLLDDERLGLESRRCQDCPEVSPTLLMFTKSTRYIRLVPTLSWPPGYTQLLDRRVRSPDHPGCSLMSTALLRLRSLLRASTAYAGLQRSDEPPPAATIMSVRARIFLSSFIPADQRKAGCIGTMRATLPSRAGRPFSKLAVKIKSRQRWIIHGAYFSRSILPRPLHTASQFASDPSSREDTIRCRYPRLASFGP